MNCELVPCFKEDCPDIPDLRVLHYQALLRPEEVAAILRISQQRVYQFCEDGTPQQVNVGKFIRISSNSVLHLLPEVSRSLTGYRVALEYLILTPGRNMG
jgi:predicted DNA-binding transcriptional regulator AlpA